MIATAAAQRCGAGICEWPCAASFRSLLFWGLSRSPESGTGLPTPGPILRSDAGPGDASRIEKDVREAREANLPLCVDLRWARIIHDTMTGARNNTWIE
jgi:hypothetical protein